MKVIAFKAILKVGKSLHRSICTLFLNEIYEVPLKEANI